MQMQRMDSGSQRRNRENSTDRYSTTSCWEASVQPKEFSSVLCDDLEGWGRGCGRRPGREGMYTHTQLIHTVAQQKLTQHCKANTCQLKK